MKKTAGILLTFVLISLAGVATAGNSTLENGPINGKDQVRTSNTKQTSTYSFTLFNFFKTSASESKSDTVKTKREVVVEEKKVSSDL